MNKKTSIALFLATTSVVALTSTGSSSLKAEESDLGGLKEWNTDMPIEADFILCLLYTSPSPRDKHRSRMPSSA